LWLVPAAACQHSPVRSVSGGSVPSSSGFLHALVKFTDVQTLVSLFHWLLPLITTWTGGEEKQLLPFWEEINKFKKITCCLLHLGTIFQTKGTMNVMKD